MILKSYKRVSCQLQLSFVVIRKRDIVSIICVLFVSFFLYVYVYFPEHSLKFCTNYSTDNVCIDQMSSLCIAFVCFVLPLKFFVCYIVSIATQGLPGHVAVRLGARRGVAQLDVSHGRAVVNFTNILREDFFCQFTKQFYTKKLLLTCW